jgi:hypothetical protein
MSVRPIAAENETQVSMELSHEKQRLKLTVPLRSILEAKRQRELRIILEELIRERVPPTVITFLKRHLHPSNNIIAAIACQLYSHRFAAAGAC